jgi:hypothetical protein
MGLITRMQWAVMGTVGPMGRRGPARCICVSVQMPSHVQQIKIAGRVCWTLQVVDLERVFRIRPARLANRAHAGVRTCRRVQAGGRTCAYVCARDVFSLDI